MVKYKEDNMDVFEITPEQEEVRLANLKVQKEAEERTRHQAEWAKLVEVAAKASPTQCCEKVYGSGRFSSFHGSLCSRPAKFHREEHVSWQTESPMATRHYCGTHDPVSKNERDRKRHDEETPERNAKWAMEDRMRVRRDLVNRVVGHLTNEQLEQLEQFLSSTPFAKAVKS